MGPPRASRQPPRTPPRRLHAWRRRSSIVERRFYEQHPPRAEYVLTGKGRQLGPVLQTLLDWGRKHTAAPAQPCVCGRSEEHTSELQSHLNLVCRLLLEK